MKKHISSSLFIMFSTFLVIVFSVCAFSFDSYALGSFESPNSSNNFSSTANIYGGCLFADYNLGAFSTNPDTDLIIRLGASNRQLGENSANTSSLYNCGYRYSSSSLNYYQHSTAMKRTLDYSLGEISTDTYSTTGGSTNIITNYNSGFASYDFDLYNQIESFDISINGANDTSFRFPSYSADDPISDTSPYALVLFTLDMPNSAALVGTSPAIGANSFNVSNSNFTSELLSNYANDSMISWCGVPSSDSQYYSTYSLFSLVHSTPDGYTPCYYVFALPLGDSTYGFYSNRTFHLQAADASRYNRSVFTTNTGLVLPYYGFPWSGMHVSPSYKQMNARYDNSFNYINPYVKIIWPESVQESQDLASAFLNLSSINNNSTSPDYEQNNSDTPSNSTIMGWFNVFDLTGVIFPFSAFYTSFSDPVNSCVNLSIIPSWLHLSNTRYCSWFSSTVINTLTPVFTIIPMMILFGFFVSWLRGDGSSSVFQEGSQPTTIHTSLGGKS